MTPPPPRVSLAGRNAVLDRAYGKPAQAMTGEGGEGPVQHVMVATGIDRLGCPPKHRRQGCKLTKPSLSSVRIIASSVQR